MSLNDEPKHNNVHIALDYVYMALHWNLFSEENSIGLSFSFILPICSISNGSSISFKLANNRISVHIYIFTCHLLVKNNSTDLMNSSTKTRKNTHNFHIKFTCICLSTDNKRSKYSYDQHSIVFVLLKTNLLSKTGHFCNHSIEFFDFRMITIE